MFTIDYPPYNFSLKNTEGKKSIFDIVRKKYVVANPEEIIRQYLIHYMVNEKGYPKSLLSVEMSLSLNNTKRRCDIVVFKDSKPIMIVECKAPTVLLNQKVFEQISRYNLVLQVPYLLVNNGHHSYCCHVNFDKQDYVFIEYVPEYADL